MNGQWQDNHEKGNKKGKVNGIKVTNALAMLVIVVLKIVHIVHE